MKLISLPLSPYSARVRGALYAKEIAFELERPPQGWMATRSLRPKNPLSRIPILQLDDGTALAESALIVEYLDEAFPGRPLFPKGALDRARVRFASAVAADYVMPALMTLFILFDAKSTDEAAISSAFEKLHEALGAIEGLLPENDYAFGGALGAADLALTPTRFSLESFVSFAPRPGLLDAYPRVRDYSNVVSRDPTLARLWQEMADGLKTFMSSPDRTS